MERARIADIHGSPYEEARYLYKRSTNESRVIDDAPVDLLQAVSCEDCERPLTGQSLENARASDTMPHSCDVYDTRANRGAGAFKGGLEYRSADKLDIKTGYGCEPSTCAEEHVHLCHKHARELENRTNTIYNCIHTLQRPYESKGTIYSKASLKKSTNTGDLMYLNQTKLKDHQVLKSELQKSTQSLPAVTYNTKEVNQKRFWNKASLLQNKSAQKWSFRNIYGDYEKGPIESGHCLSITVKRLLLVLCVLIGLLMILGGIAIGLIVLSKNTSTKDSICGEGYVDCGDVGCMLYTGVCQSSRLHVCPSYVSILCSQLKPASNSSSTIPTIGMLPLHDETRIYVDIVYDERGWAHFINSSGQESKFKVLNKVTTYSGAQEHCMRTGGHLAHITSIREQLFLEQFLRAQTAINDASPEVRRGYWIGARRARGSHSRTCMSTQWRWLDAHGRALGDITSFSAFAVGKPDNYYKPEECVYITTDNTFGENSFLKWDDVPCDMPGMGERLPLCEVDLRQYS